VRTADGTEDAVVKSRGFTMTNETIKKLNVDLMRRQVMMFVNEGRIEREDIEVPQFKRRKQFEVGTYTAHKTHRMVFDKRVVFSKSDNFYLTTPFGYRDELLDDLLGE
jgi:hypothetical protein